jgi:hypothetical protein
MRNILTKVIKKIKTHFMFNKLFPKNRAVYEIMWKTFVRATDGNTADAHCVLDTEG